jgi:small subunit ribosomal protein S15
MALEGDKKKQFIAEHRKHETDSGSPEVQIALLTKRLEELAVHFKQHPQDKHSRRGLLKIVSNRKRLLRYLKNEDVLRYRETLARHGLRK